MYIYTYVRTYLYIHTYYCKFNNCNMNMSALPDWYTQIPEGCKPEGRECTYTDKRDQKLGQVTTYVS